MVGRLTGVQPDVGTIVGTNCYGEPMVVIAVDDAGCTLRTAHVGDIPVLTAPRSVMEFRLIPRRNSVFGLIRKLHVQ